MHPKVKKLLKRDDDEFLNSLMQLYPYRRPADFVKLSSGGKKAVCAFCFSCEVFSGGYFYVLERLSEWIDEILETLKAIGANEYLEALLEIVEKARAEGYEISGDSDWCEFDEKHDGFREYSVRDYSRVIGDVTTLMRCYIKDHPEEFDELV